MLSLGQGRTSAWSIALPLTLLAGLVVAGASQIGWQRIPGLGPAVPRPPTTIVAARSYTYREPGEFYLGTAQIDGPLLAVEGPAPLEIMTYQVRAADYARCTADGACQAASPRRLGEGDVPATGVSFDDAIAYSASLSAGTGEIWRLPTVAEWTFAAGERAVDPAVSIAPGGDPAERWLALYEREATLGAGALAAPELLGAFGFNSFGVADIGGSVWEWTATCASHTTVDAQGTVLATLASCGVRYLEGRHRTQMSSFIRDARAGGCSSGTPPDNLGFRLVREPTWLDEIAGTLR